MGRRALSKMLLKEGKELKKQIQGALLSEHILPEDLPLVVPGIRQAKPSLEKHLPILERTRKTSSSGGRGKRKYWTGVIFHEEEGPGDP